MKVTHGTTSIVENQALELKVSLHPYACIEDVVNEITQSRYVTRCDFSKETAGALGTPGHSGKQVSIIKLWLEHPFGSSLRHRRT